MTTHRLQSTVDVRSWLDFDQKFLGPAVTLIGTIAVAGVELATRSVTWVQAGGEVGPVFIAAALAYVATSQHKALIDHTVKTTDKVVDAVAPLVGAVDPKLAPVVAETVKVADTVTARVDGAVEDFAAPTGK